MALRLLFAGNALAGSLRINTPHSGSVTARMINQKRLQIGNRLQRTLRHRSLRKRLVRICLVTANVAVLGAAVAFVVSTSHTDHSTATRAVSDAQAANPVDGITSYDIAAAVAHTISLPEVKALDAQAQSAKVAQAVSASDTAVAPKPQIVATALKSRKDIQTYVVQAGDTVTTIAQKFSVTTDSIKWSNGLTADTVALGTTLTVPPTGVNGIVYTVKTGDTIQSLATKYKANADLITLYNDPEISGLQVGEQIIIPGGQAQIAASRSGAGLLLGAGSFVAQYGSNGYDYGYCTYYAAARSGAPSNWGNANTWAYYAALSGWTVSSTPKAGAIAQTSAGYLGHVAIVEAVSDDGTQIKYSDMNGIAGWGRVGYSDWVPATHFEHYIYR
ncbi:MAG TPA: LysM peptidoglycan-binding domain-containing protein [Candidatus Saccharimonadales bacterium]|nr:LysM peptidoglycan-binding domain-containing protein [Candidatus Saccharimonadales bacterium]